MSYRSSSKVDNDTQALWSVYNKQDRSIEDVRRHLESLKLNHGDAAAKMQQFDKELRYTEKVAAHIANRLTSKHSNITSSMIISKIRDYQSKYKFTEDMVASILDNVIDITSGTGTADMTRFDKVNYNQIGHMLGQPKLHTVGAVEIQQDDRPYLTEIIRICDADTNLHYSLINQTLTYDNLFVDNKTEPIIFKGEVHSPGDAAMPLICALFIPKIPCLEKHFLIPSLGRIIKERSEGKSPKFSSDYNLMWQICRDSNTFSCTPADTSPMNDCLARVRIQAALWHTVFHMRNGSFFQKGNDILRSLLYQCNPNVHMGPDMLINHDEHRMLNRMLSALAFRPVFIHKSPLQLLIPGNNFGGTGAAVNPFAASSITSIASVDQIPFMQVRAPNWDDTSADPNPTLDRLLEMDYYTNPLTSNIQSYRTKVVYVNEVFIVYINRHRVSFNIHHLQRMTDVFRFTELPFSDFQNAKPNLIKIEIGQTIQLGEKKDTFDLVSYVSIPPVRVNKIGETRTDIEVVGAGDPHSSLYNPYTSEAWIVDPTNSNTEYRYNSSKIVKARGFGGAALLTAGGGDDDIDPEFGNATRRRQCLSKVLVFAKRGDGDIYAGARLH